MDSLNFLLTTTLNLHFSAKKKQAFFAGPASPSDAVSHISTIISLLRSESVEKVGAVGFCWGGKACILAAGEEVGLDAIGLVHPSWVPIGLKREP